MKIVRTTAPVVTVEVDRFDGAVSFYERLYGETVRARLKNPTGKLDLALIGPMLLIGGSPPDLVSRKDLKATFVVDDLAEWHDEICRIGGEIVEGPTPGPMSADKPIGRYLFARHPDGGLFEYVQLGAE